MVSFFHNLLLAILTFQAVPNLNILDILCFLGHQQMCVWGSEQCHVSLVKVFYYKSILFPN